MDVIDADSLLNIFSKFSLRQRIRLEAICRRWHRILQNTCAYSDIRSIEVHEFMRPSTSKYYDDECAESTIINVLRRCGPFIQKIDFGGRWLKIKQPIIDCIATHCHRLKYLDLGCTVIDADISTVLNNNVKTLEYFSLEDASWTNTEYQTKVNFSLQHMERMRNINLRHFNFIPNIMFNVGCELRELDLSAATNVNAYALHNFLNQQGTELVELNVCPFPTVVNESTNNDDNSNNKMPLVFNAVPQLKQLKMLSIGHVVEIPQHCSMVSLGELVNLRFLHIQECKSLDMTSLRTITAGLHQLRTLHLIKCTNIDNYSCLANMKTIRELEIRHSKEIHNNDVIRIAMNGTLKRIRLEMCSNITNEAVIAVIKFCPKIKELELTKCESIDENLFSKTDNWANLKNLQTLSLNGTTSITNKSMKELANTELLSSLQELDISHNKNMDNTTMTLLHEILMTKDNDNQPQNQRTTKTLTVYVFQTEITENMEERVFPKIELIF